ncbi:hypothetical protein [Streptomyces sp. NBC_00859]
MAERDDLADLDGLRGRERQSGKVLVGDGDEGAIGVLIVLADLG